MSTVISSWTGRIVSGAAIAAWGSWAYLHLARHGDRLDLGYLFFLGLVGLGLLVYGAGRWDGRPLPRFEALTALLLLGAAAAFERGIARSAAELFSIHAFNWYVLAGVLLWAALQFRGPEPQRCIDAGPAGPAWGRGLALLAAAGLAAAALVWMDAQIHSVWAYFEDRTSTSLFFFRRHLSATDISGYPFRQPMLLLLPLAYGAALAAWVYRVWKRGAFGSREAFWGLLAFSLLGKLCLAALSSSGLAIIGLKISSVNTAYYTLTDAIDTKGLYAFIRDYNQIQVPQGPHGDTHPPGPMVLYWGLKHLFFGQTWLVGFSMALLCSLILWPIHAIARRAYGSAEAGFAAALLYLASPAGLMLSGAGIDAFLALLLALVLERIDASVREDGGGLFIRAAQAGAILFAATLMGFGGAVVLAFAGLYALQQARSLSGSLLQGLVRAVLALGTVLLVALLAHLLLHWATGGKFDYIASLNGSAGAHRNANFSRHYEIWGWANLFLFSAYLGLGAFAAWALGFVRALWRGDSRDSLLAIGAYQALFLAAASMGRGEVQREFLYGMLFLSLPATAYLLTERQGRVRARGGLLALAVGLNLCTAVAIQAIVLDFW